MATYLRYLEEAQFGVVTSSTSNSVFDWHGENVFTAALERVAVWNPKQGELKKSLGMTTDKDHKTGSITALERCPDGKHIAAGYSNGDVKVWNIQFEECVLTFEGHDRAVTTLAYSPDGVLLASGGKDTNILVWDVEAQKGLCKLDGHRNVVTSLQWLWEDRKLISGSEDQYVCVWDMETRRCIQTVVTLRSPVRAMAIVNTKDSGRQLVVGTDDHALAVFKVDGAAEIKTADTAISALTVPSHPLARAPESGSEDESTDEEEVDEEKAAREEAEKIAARQAEVDAQYLSRNTCNVLAHFGSLLRKGSASHRVSGIKVTPCHGFIAVHGTDANVELISVLTAAEGGDRLKRRQKRFREKMKKMAEDDPDGVYTAGLNKEPKEADKVIGAQDLFLSLGVANCPARVRSVDFAPGAQAEAGPTPKHPLRMAAFMNDNSMMVLKWELTMDSKGRLRTCEAVEECVVERNGHRSGVRAVGVSSKGALVVSGSARSVKVWNSRSRRCILSLETGYALKTLFCPGDRHVAVATREGTLEVYDVASGDVHDSVAAHEGAIWGLCHAPDGKGIVTCSADRDVKFWRYKLADNEGGSGQKLTLELWRTMTMAGDALSVCCSPDGKFLAVSLIDHTVKVFFYDTLKFYLDLYGHKLPVLDLDISDDSTKIATASADKNVKIWGLDFGDCQRSLFAHSDSVTSVQFVPNTHHFFTTSKDRSIKYWDGDSFQLISTLSGGHQAEVWCLAMASNGGFFVTASHDRSLRVWKRSDEMLFLEEEQEKRLEEEFEEGVVADAQKASETTNVDGTAKLGKDSISAGERLVEALIIAEKEKAREEYWKTEVVKAREMADYQRQMIAAGGSAAEVACPPGATAPLPSSSSIKVVLPKKPASNPLMMRMSPQAYVLWSLKRIPYTKLESALLVIPFTHVLVLVEYIEHWIVRGASLELAARVLFFLVRAHRPQMLSHATLSKRLDAISTKVRARLRQHKDAIGFNQAGLAHLKSAISESQQTSLGKAFDFGARLKQVHARSKGVSTSTVDATKFEDQGRRGDVFRKKGRNRNMRAIVPEHEKRAKAKARAAGAPAPSKRIPA